MKRAGRTPPFRGPNGRILARSIAEVGYRRLGGVDQWVMIRGADLANPPLILLHGGPGFPETGFFRLFNRPLEKSFTVVYWEQRGSGRSFDPHIARSSMTVEQFIADLDELVDQVRSRLGQDQVVILGHSWGTALGLLYAARFPQKVAAYVGAAQISDAAAAEAASYDIAVAQAKRLRNGKAMKALRAIGRPPYDARAVFTERTWLQRMDGAFRPKGLWLMARTIFGSPESSIFGLRNLFRGFRFTMDVMWPEVSKLNLPEVVSELKMPVFFFVGRRDHWVPPEMSAAYLEKLSAPSKRLVWFETSGHEMFADEPKKFNRVMVEEVLPAL